MTSAETRVARSSTPGVSTFSHLVFLYQHPDGTLLGDHLATHKALVCVATFFVLLSGCGQEATTTALTRSPSGNPLPAFPSSTKPSEERAPLPAASSSPTALAGERLRAALLTAADLGSGWRVTKQALHPSKSERQDIKDFSPECQDLYEFLFSGTITKSDPTSAFRELVRGNGMSSTIVTIRITPMPEGGFSAFQEHAASLIEDCPTLSLSTGKGNSPAMPMIFESLSMPGRDDLYVVESEVNAIYFRYYFFFGFAPVGGNIVTVSTGWIQKSSKTFMRTMDLAISKVATEAGVGGAPADSLSSLRASRTPSGSETQLP